MALVNSPFHAVGSTKCILRLKPQKFDPMVWKWLVMDWKKEDIPERGGKHVTRGTKRDSNCFLVHFLRIKQTKVELETQVMEKSKMLQAEPIKCFF